MGKIKKVFAIVLACALAMLLVPKAGAEEAREFNPKYDAAVSYTHLTLPTKRIV